eukprot:4356984-Amphidinium_carterae.1
MAIVFTRPNILGSWMCSTDCKGAVPRSHTSCLLSDLPFPIFELLNCFSNQWQAACCTFAAALCGVQLSTFFGDTRGTRDVLQATLLQ